MTIEELLDAKGSAACVITAQFSPVAGQDRFQPAGFPEIGHVIYKAPRSNGEYERVCIVDSAASMANHLESVCLAGAFESGLHPDLAGLPYVACVTDRNRVASEDNLPECVVCTSLTEGHRLASDYFLDGQTDVKWTVPEPPAKGKKENGAAGWKGTTLRDRLRGEFGIVEVTKDKKYFVYPDNWWTIFSTIFEFDPNSLVHGVLFAKEQIKISRLLSASMEAFGADRVGRSGVKFDRLGKTTSGQPIFAVDEETATEIRATFVIDLALLRSYGRDGVGLNGMQKRLLLELALWKVARLTAQPFRFRSGCFLGCTGLRVEAGDAPACELPRFDIGKTIAACQFRNGITCVYYPATELFKAGKDEEADARATTDDEPQDEVK